MQMVYLSRFVNLFSKKFTLLSLTGLYFFISILLNIFFQSNNLLPCLWKTFFYFECPGCGITTSFIELLKGNFIKAWLTNKLIFIIISLVFFCSIRQCIRLFCSSSVVIK